MTDPTPTPTRAEVERFGCDQLGMDKMPDGEWVRFTDYQALRDRAEAAERAEVAAWNDAIEAAAQRVGDLCKFDARKCDAEAIRALRRAAPTEGEA